MSKIAELIAFAKNNPNVFKEINFGNVPNFLAQEINTKTSGTDVRSAVKVLTTFGITHIFSSHGDHQKESLRGQVGVTEADFEKIPEILNSPDSIEKGNISKKGDEAVLFKKTFANKIYHVVMNLKKAKNSKTLVVGTMYIKRA